MVRASISLIGQDLTFDEGPHIYKYKGEQFISATTVLKPYFPFDRDGVALKCTKGRNPLYKGKTVEEVLAIWQKKADLGTRVHLFVEDWLNGNFVTVTDNYERGFLKWLQRFAPNMEDVITEVQICNPDWKISGMIDALIKIKGGWWIVDWKSDKRIASQSFSKKEFCPGVLGSLQVCNLNKFKMQLGLYRHILASEWYDIPIAGMMVVHCDEHGKVMEHTIPYLKDELDMLINVHLGSTQSKEDKQDADKGNN